MAGPLLLTHVGGTAPFSQRAKSSHNFTVSAVATGLQFHRVYGELSLRGSKPVLAYEIPWSELHSLDISSTQTSRANVGAIIAFGVVGMASHRRMSARPSSGSCRLSDGRSFALKDGRLLREAVTDLRLRPPNALPSCKGYWRRASSRPRSFRPRENASSGPCDVDGGCRWRLGRQQGA